MRVSSILIGLLSVISPAAVSAESLHLVCSGGGSATKVRGSNAFVTTNTGQSAYGGVTTTSDVGFSDQVDVEIEGEEGRVRMPRFMLPPVHGGKDGWFELKKLKVSDREITGKAGLNVFNSPNVRIDRITGFISISGNAGNFVAPCKPFDPATAQRAF